MKIDYTAERGTIRSSAERERITYMRKMKKMIFLRITQAMMFWMAKEVMISYMEVLPNAAIVRCREESEMILFTAGEGEWIL